jgi:DnaK suppressor protein
MEDVEVQKFRRMLLQRRQELLSVKEAAEGAAETVELDQTRVGRLSRMDALQLQAMSLENKRRRELALKRISAALSRVNEDEYGYCVNCGNEIAQNRLEVDPAAPLCIACAEASERKP